jgi:pimeloyl-ACP methyl ester carboxylesterase
MRRERVAVNGIELHLRATGSREAPLILFLHGFPEFSGAWDGFLPHFADRHYAVAPDQRGYASSSKPEGVDAYRVRHLVRDILALGDLLSPDRPYAIVAHDWGASVAYATAIATPARVSRLAVINGVHPGPFQRALIESDAQRQASAYFHYLRDPKAEERLSASNYEKLLRMMTGFGQRPWMTDAQRAEYLEAWSQPGALTGMLNWYRATPIVVPKPGEAVDPGQIPRWPPEQLRIRMPHLLIWGMEDGALLPVTRDGLDAYCDDLTVREIEGADHWVCHEEPQRVLAHLRDFLAPARQ